jgi:hypothetical protein
MKINTKRIITVFLAALVVLCMMPTPQSKVQAENKTEKVTLFKGETLQSYSFGGKITKVSSSNKKVAKVKKDSDYKALITAKKKGKANITIKCQRGTITYKVTVLDTESSFDFSVQQIKSKYNSSIDTIVKVKNKTSQSIRDIKCTYTLKDSTGVELETASMYIYGLASKQCGYGKFTADSSIISQGVDITKTSFTITEINRRLDTKNLKKKETVKEKDFSKDENNKTITLTVSAKNKAKTSANVYIFLFAYDASGNIIGYKHTPLYLQSDNGLKTEEIKLYLSTDASEFASYKMVWTAVS